jgi:predicted AlkP superfamily phosphohydrolase/phosphomutase
LIDAYDPDTIFVVSDHGGTGTTDWVVFTNDWLMRAGLLSLSPSKAASAGQRVYAQAKRRMSVPARRALRPLLGRVLERAKDSALYGDFDWSRSTAYAHMQPAVRLNLAGREPSGTVTEEGRAAALERIAARAADLRLPDGSLVFADATPSDAVYSGDAPLGPDLVFELAPGMHIRSRNMTGRPGDLLRLQDLGTYMPSGVHSPRGMFAATGTGIERAGRVADGDIHQVAPSLLAIMDVPTPPLDAEPFGFVTKKVLHVDEPTRSAATAEPTEGRPKGAASPGDGELSDLEEAEVLERLRGLGYVD